MSKHRFGKETIEYIEKNKYVKKITESQIIFTDEFKKIVVDKSNQGIKPTQIFREAEIPYQILSENQIHNSIRRFKEQSKRAEGFARINGSGRPKREKPEFKTMEEELQYYKDQAEYYRQENDFIKKIQALEEKEAARLSRAKNSKS